MSPGLSQPPVCTHLKTSCLSSLLLAFQKARVCMFNIVLRTSRHTFAGVGTRSHLGRLVENPADFTAPLAQNAQFRAAMSFHFAQGGHVSTYGTCWMACWRGTKKKPPVLGAAHFETPQMLPQKQPIATIPSLYEDSRSAACQLDQLNQLGVCVCF